MRHHHHHRYGAWQACGGAARSPLRAMLQAMRGDDRPGAGPRGFGRGGRGPSDGRGDRGRRMFEGGELRLVMLLLLEAEPRHGYDIIRAIEARTGGAYAPSPGIIYPTLTLLEDIGQVEARPAPGPKRLYAITTAGQAQLDAQRPAAEAALARLDALAGKAAALDSGPVFRAMGNLKAALTQRLGATPDRETVFAVVDAIDEAVRKIERL